MALQAGFEPAWALPIGFQIICQDNVLGTSVDKMKENGFKLTKERRRR